MTTAARERVAIPPPIREAILAHARETGSLECCGLVAGRASVPTRTIRCANVAPDPRIRYRIDPREQLAAFRAMDEAGEELVGIYHSHPASPPYPSPTDRAESFYPDALYVLVSLRSSEPELRAYRIRSDAPGAEKTVKEVDVA